MIKSFLFAFTLLLFMPLFAQDEKSSALFSKEDTKKKGPLLEVGLRQSGPYFGIQQGKYTLAEIGGEMQWRKIRLKNPTTHAIHAGLDYNLFESVLGFSTGYYYKGGRTKFTFGGSLVYRTDVTHHRFGISPALGYKLFGFHGQVGYALLTPHDNFVAVNNLFVSLRFVLINERDVELNSRLKKKK